MTVVAFLVLVAAAVVLADRRVALVVGNSTYAPNRRLPNPENDAADIAAALRWLGFEVTTEYAAAPGRAARSALRAERGGGNLAGALHRPRASRWIASGHPLALGGTLVESLLAVVALESLAAPTNRYQ